jgi:hypothetical protein
MNIRRLLLTSLFALPLTAGLLHAQPTPAPAGGDLLCGAGGASPVDTSAAARLDTLASTPDAEGFFSLFDGTSFKGWWQNCRSSHSSSDRTNGAIWRIDTARKAIYSTQRGTNTGGLLSTHKRYLHYEVVFETWAGFGNDAGFFHRNTVTGACYQTVLDYLSGASFGGTWGEGSGYPGRDHRPASFSGNDSTLTIPGTAGHNWTTFSAGRLAAGETFSCPSTGCTQAEWRQHWKLGSNPAVTDGWNTVRIKFYGGTSANQSLATPGADKVRMRSWFKSKLDTASRVSTIAWIPMWSDSIAYTSAQAALYGVPNPIAFQVHGGGRFGAARGTWYRNIRIRELDSLGNPLPFVTAIQPSSNSPQIHYENVRMTPNALIGSIDLPHTIVVSDLQGRVLEQFQGDAGSFDYRLKSSGLLLVQIRTVRGVENLRVGRFQ